MYLCNHQNDNVFPPPSLPSELIVEILLKLPARTLVQLRCVCKLWKTLISDPNFAKKHFLISIADTSMTNQRLAFEDCSYPLKSLFENSSTRVIPDIFNGFEIDQYCMMGSCNGFLCLYDPDQYNMIMYNPSIGLKSQTSPEIEPSPDWGNWGTPINGFGYDHVNDKYKVLAVVKPDYGYGPESMTIIYTFGEDSWRTIQDLPCTPSQMLGKYVSGTLNWIGSKENIWASFAPESMQEIFSFDMEKETYRDVLLPQNVGEEYGVVDSWTKLLNIPREKLVILHSIDQYSIIELLFISEKGVVLLMIYREHLISPRW
ncbi:hypothetical protein TSUD_191460 [Trifolium subterraneum]|uniref:F-box domain-containing protein n=1 Tax=Trifolium subterraneum TaxID=3900 RepID=A0A2Z6NY74_TRISU|nr:hypothetical protein TSUD_191460 [Trifolium subterraneum]